MISDQTIKNLTNKYQTTLFNIQREYYQNMFLARFYEQAHAAKIFFKGGTALRLIFKSPRFSEDLDFSTNATVTQIETTIVEAGVNLERENNRFKIKETKTTSGGYLAILEFNQIQIQLEFSLRKKGITGELITIVNNFIPPYPLMILTTKILVTEKIQALLTRQKPRDFYDLYFILRSNLLPAKDKKVLTKVAPLLKNSTINFSRELKIFLPKSHWLIIKNFKENLQREIERQI